ncbi:MAG: hypothetical protein QXQ40_02295 [Candidatus Aenigmatarchaeota archaeon]
MKIIKVSVISEGGKVTIPMEIRKKWGIDNKKAKIAWYTSDEKIYVEVVK